MCAFSNASSGVLAVLKIAVISGVSTTHVPTGWPSNRPERLGFFSVSISAVLHILSAFLGTASKISPVPLALVSASC